jgi:hypothetical protein
MSTECSEGSGGGGAGCGECGQGGCGSSQTSSGLGVEPWSWEISNGSASSAQTKRAYQILLGNSPAGGFSYKVWNDLVDKVAEMRKAAKNWGWDPVVLTKDKTYVSSDTILSADIYNSLRYNIGSVKSTGSEYVVESGDEILGKHIVNIVEILNEIIAGDY